MLEVPINRITTLNDDQPNMDAPYVLYWMIAFRRTSYNFSLQRAIEWANKLSKPLLIFEPIEIDYPMASIRFHKFAIEGMQDMQKQTENSKAFYFPYVEEKKGIADDLLVELSKNAAVVVTDDYPTYFVPQMTAEAKGSIQTTYELVDSNGLLPIRIAEKEYVRAHDFRRFMHKNLEDFLVEVPEESPLEYLNIQFDEKLLEPILKKYELIDFNNININDFLNNLNVDKSVEISQVIGGYGAAQKRLDHFIKNGFNDYSKLRSHPSEDASSQLSPHFHFGHISTYEVFEKIISSESWSVENIDPNFVGRREGWWGGSANLESFFDELITWRELGYHTCVKRANYDQYQSLPDWAIKTLDEHTNDEREYVYDLSEFMNGDTHDEIWNAAQNQLRIEGRIHNYLRMLWGKKILEWTPNPQIALSYLIDLNDRFALDGRDPNSYSGVFWILGRYDRAWGPERPIYGKIRYMTSKSTATKFNLKPYLEKWSHESKI